MSYLGYDYRFDRGVQGLIASRTPPATPPRWTERDQCRRLAGVVSRLADRIDAVRGEAGDQPSAAWAAIEEQFKPSLANLVFTRALAEDRARTASGRSAAFETLASGLSRIEQALTTPWPSSAPAVRGGPDDIRAATALHEAAKRALKRLSMAMMAGMATVALASPVFAACITTGNTLDCTGVVPPVAATAPISTVNVHGLTQNIVPASTVPAVAFDADGAGGSGGSNNGSLKGVGGGGNPGAVGVTGTLAVDTGADSIIATGAKAYGVYGSSNGGTGGDGGDGTGVVGYGGDGGQGGNGGQITITTSGVINTNGDQAHGVYGIADGGNGGSGGSGKGVDGEGGDGAAGGAGGAVVITNHAAITTEGSESIGIFGQSVGGTGGGGGEGKGVASSGGSGSPTSAGGTVDIHNDGTINTVGDASDGVFAQSVGGFGGSGGSASGLFAYGGGGAAGGPGAVVSIENSGNVTTQGAQSFGLFAQSVGGGGGSGGSGGGLVALGAGGASGADGGQASVTNSGVIQTNGEGAIGVFSQSVGGGGGDGGSGGGLVAIGGSGSGTSGGGEADLINTGQVTTAGDNAQALFAQSIGGGGGNGGSAGGLVAIGGQGGVGGTGGLVNLTNSGDLQTSGDNSAALEAQSIGGGGGNGGNAGSVGLFASVAVGGQGASGGDGGIVNVNITNTAASADANIVTSGDRSDGVLAQSVGGGGGNGGYAFAGSVGPDFSAAVAVGGSGAKGGDAGLVSVGNNGTILTTGDDSVGIAVQSIGGGGGNGGFAVAVSGSDGVALDAAVGGGGGPGGSSGGAVLNSWTSIETTGAQSYGILAQSLGGGGGDGGFSVAVAAGGEFSGSLGLGGKGGIGGSAGDVGVTSIGGVTTWGDGADGIVAQSIGGGGGAGGFSVTGSFTTGAAGIGVSLGGDGGPGANAGNVVLKSTGAIFTDGAAADGLVAQSIGGGGGDGGFSGSIAASTGGSALSVALGGSGGTGAYAGEVDLTNIGDITTEGDRAVGALAESIGGGGRSGGFSVSLAGGDENAASVSLGGSGATGGTGGVVNLISTGDITTYGAQAYGLLAESIGGGGGDGGFSASGSFAAEDTSISASLGGAGGTGNTGGAVTLDSTGTVATYGAGAYAVFAQSVGGGGGAGGFCGSLSLSTGDGSNISLSLGGTGGAAGTAGQVQVTTIGQLYTAGLGSTALLAQSVGGKGGDGGYSFSGALTDSETAVNLSVSLGGDGGSGGAAGEVDVTNLAAIETTGDEARGIFAQSVGGGGGDGGLSVSGDISTSAKAKQISVSLGGSGGGGNDGGVVSVISSGAITTLGDNSIGIEAQSVGGGGGDGGVSVSGTLAGADAKNLSVSLGGGAGEGGDGMAVGVTSSGDIYTAGYQSIGIEAQSVGGGGGNGGGAYSVGLGVRGEGSNVNASVAVGGAGGDGGVGGAVTVNNLSGITTTGDVADAILAQSVGGGGGVGGSTLTAVVGISPNPATAQGRQVNASVSVGGGGGNGNTGGLVTVSNAGSLFTTGDDSAGIYAQSVGGGGGEGGSAGALSMIIGKSCPQPDVCKPGDKASNKINLRMIVGGDGGGASNGGAVSVVNTGSIVTEGVNATGIFAQSIGGGGGDGGGGTLEGLGNFIGPPGSLAAIVIGKSSQLSNLSVTLGGSAGSSGDGSTVGVDNQNAITTYGQASTAIWAESVGGGGGKIAVGGTAASGATGTVGIGGSGGAAGDGGKVTVSNEGAITTYGDDSMGIFAQSVGGGGGMAGGVQRGVPNGINTPVVDVPYIQDLGIGLAFGGSGGGGGDGAAVLVTNTGTISTSGAASTGIFAQSVGGGGGVIGDLGNNLPVLSYLDFAGSVGDAGSGGTVTVNQNGKITTTGSAAYGVFAQSAGGTGTGGAVSVVIGGDTKAYGVASDGVFVQSLGEGGNGTESVLINTGTVQGGTGADSTGVEFADGAANTLVNHGTVMAADGIGGWAVRGGAGDEAISSDGVLIGSIDLGAGTNSLHNQAAGAVYSGATIALGAGNLFQNDGLFSPGGAGLVQTTAITGNLIQSATGIYGVDLDLMKTGQTGEADLATVSGAAIVGGQVKVGVLNGGYALPGQHSVVILTAAGGYTDSSLALSTPASAVATYSLSETATALSLNYGINFAPAGLNANEHAIGSYINAIQTAGGSAAFRPTANALFFIPTVGQLGAAYDQLSPEPYLDTAISASYAAQRFADGMFSCTASTATLADQPRDGCVWVRMDSRQLTVTQTGQTLRSAEGDGGMAFGAERRVGPNLTLGAAASFETLSQSVDTADSEGQRFQGGLSLKTHLGWADVAAAVTLGTENLKTDRVIDLPMANNVIDGKSRVTFGSENLRISHRERYGRWYVKPALELEADQVHLGAVHETGGAGGVNLIVGGRTEQSATVRPTLEVGGEFANGRNTILRPYLKVGVSELVAGASPALSASFDGAPASVAPFVIHGRRDQTLADVSGGVEMVNDKGASLKGQVFGDYGAHTSNEGVGLKLTIPF